MVDSRTTTERIAGAADELRATLPDARVEMELFPSGSAMIDVRRGDRLFVMAYSPTRGFGVDEVRENEGLQVSYAFAFDSLSAATEKLVELATGTSPHATPRLNLVVLRAQDIRRSRDFYELLGLEFREEQHGSGPQHFAAELGGTVLEVYPCKDAADLSRSTRLGFEVANVDAIIDVVRRSGASVVTEPHDSPWGRRAVVCDPDGHKVELSSVANN